jgi:uncharacterized membrane protein
MLNRLARLVRHLLETHGSVRRRFTPDVLDRIERAVRASEARHGGEVRVVIETDLDAWSILAGRPSRHRALEVFALQGVWDTAENNGLLLYVLFADRAVEIVADRGYAGRVEQAEWDAVCRAVEAEFKRSRWEQGVVAGVERVSAIAERCFPLGERGDAAGDELPDRPLLL